MSREILSIALLTALGGDCIHIIYTNGARVRRHIVVDSGPVAFAAGFSALLAEIKAQRVKRSWEVICIQTVVVDILLFSVTDM